MAWRVADSLCLRPVGSGICGHGRTECTDKGRATAAPLAIGAPSHSLGMCRRIEMENAPSVMFDHGQAIEHTKSQRRNGEEVEGGNHLTVIAEKGQPGLSPPRVLCAASDRINTVTTV